MEAIRTVPEHAMTMWSTGRPPAPGWFVASTDRDARMQRYFDADTGRWSAPCWGDDDHVHMERARAARGRWPQRGVEWLEAVALAAAA